MIEKIKAILDDIPPAIDRGEDFDPYSWCGANCDDCYAMGVEDGQSQLADYLREILKEE